MRLLRSGLSRIDIQPKIERIVAELFRRIPTGVGAGRRDLKLSRDALAGVLERGSGWAVGEGFGTAADLEHTEEGGVLPGAEAERVSDRAFERGKAQLGTLGSGNHFAEIQYVSQVYDAEAARAFGLEEGQVTVMIHSGSRGLGHQVCTDWLKTMAKAGARYGITLPDAQLACAPIRSPEGRGYLAAMAAAANYAFANRQVMTHWVRESFAEVLGLAAESLGMTVVYDVCHNIAKLETFELDGRSKRLCVHRKGATRAYPPGHAQTPSRYRGVGQPVLVPGDMGRYSYVLRGTEVAFRETFGSCCHGAGRRMSRHQAKKSARGRRLLDELKERGVIVMAAGMATVAEEMPEAYKDVADVVDVVHRAGIGLKVARLTPIGVVKG